MGKKEDPQIQTPIQKKTIRVARKGFSVPVGKINEILKHATKQDLNAIKGRWAEIMERNVRMFHKLPLLKDAEPVAASEQAFVIKFKYEIHCQMAMDKLNCKSQLLIVKSLIGKKTAGCRCT